MARVVYLVQDLFFVAKIEEAGAQLDVPVEAARDAAALGAAARHAGLVIVDLRRPDALAALELLAADPETAGVPAVGFVDHENVEVMRAAAARGCGQVLSKRKFTADLPALLAGARG
jgi:CheY-like chemotaxis protein